MLALAIPFYDITDYSYSTAWLFLLLYFYRLANTPRPNSLCKIKFVNMFYKLCDLPKTKVSKTKAINIIIKGILKACAIARNVGKGR